ncbi:hypothetical protein [Burkholderia vietnamiensis]|uniref:hypothetical protein n=1 Tax=Burkholderia vietnamiensis TaxID=60552 RepID=UPI001BA2B55F|nr:hypothetical protein [Burkholderia vietnamiensis]MBR8000357.1 hypothetical protein [Burkholderia vietnamiensis]
MATKAVLAKTIIACVVAVAAGEASAITTLGDRSCGKWASHGVNTVQNAADISWLAGMMTGLSVALSIDVLANTDGESIALWMDNYCRSHPLNNVGTGASELFIELVGRMQKKP